MRTLGIIPARGKSKGLPGKNIKELNGKPLIAWTITQALNSKLISKVFISTEDKEIADIALKYGAEVPFLRPEEMADDDSPTIDAVLYSLQKLEDLGETFDIVCLLEPTSPLRKNNDIDNGLKLLSDNFSKADAVISLGEIHLENPRISKIVEKSYLKPFIEEKNQFYQRQQLPKVYFPYGVFYIVKTEILKKTKTFYTDRSLPYLIERWQNYEIDDIYDFICIESIMNYKKEEFI